MSGRKRREVKGKRGEMSPPPKTTGGNLGKGGKAGGKTPKGSNHASPRPGGGGGANNTNNNGNGPKKGSSHHKRTDNPPPALTETQEARAAALEELLQTESDYCADLDTFIQIYLEPLRGSTIISPEDVKMIFGNVEDIWLGNMKLLQSLESARKALPSNRPMMHMLKVGDIFVAVAQRGAFIAYPAYCNNYEAASARAEELAEENATFAAFLKGAQNDSAAKHMNVYDFLSKPFQRILKYPLLLKEVLKHSPRGNTEYAALQKALTLMENIAADANSARRVLDLAGSIDGVPRYLNLDVTTARRVVREGSALVNKDERQLVLFTDILLISKGSGKKSKYERHLELHQLSLQPVPNSDDSLELMDTANKGAVYTLRWKGNDDLRNVWYETLETYIARAIEAFQPSSAVGVGAFTSLFASGKSLQDRVRGLLGGGAGTGSTRVPPVEKPSMSGKGGTELALFAMPGVGVGSSSSAKGSFRTGPGGMSTGGGGGGLGAGAGVGASMKSMGSTRGVDRPKGGSRKAMAWHLEKLTELKGRIEGLPDDFELIDAERRFLREGPLLKISEGKHTDRVFILFSDVLIYGEAAKAKKSGGEILRFKKMIWLHEAHVKEYEATGATQSVYSNLAFQVERLEAKVTKTYTLKAETVADKEAWMKDLQAAIEKMKARRGTRDDESTRPGGAGSTDVDGSVAPMHREADRGYILNDYEMRLKDFPPYPERPEGMSDEIWSLTEKAYAAKKEVAIENLKMEDAKAKRKALERQERALRATLSATRKALEEFRALLDADLDNVLVLLDRTHKPKGEGRSRRKGGGGSGRKAGGGSARRGPSAPKGPKK